MSSVEKDNGAEASTRDSSGMAERGAVNCTAQERVSADLWVVHATVFQVQCVSAANTVSGVV